MKTYICILSLFSSLLMSCSRDILDRTIFIPDENNPELPAYTEWGYNSFGAFFERNVLVSTHDIIPCKVVYENNMLSFSLIGQLRQYSWSSHAFEKTTLTFSFPLSEVKTIEDLSILHDTKIDLAEHTIVDMRIENIPAYTLDVLSGEIHFRRFQLLRVDGMLNRIILSGTFDLRFIRNEMPESISLGRFDIGLTERDFLSY